MGFQKNHKFALLLYKSLMLFSPFLASEIQVSTVSLLETIWDGHKPLRSSWACREQSRYCLHRIRNMLCVQPAHPQHVNMNGCQVLSSGYSFTKILPHLSRRCLEGPVIWNVAGWTLHLPSNKNQTCNMVYASHRSAESPVTGLGRQYHKRGNSWLTLRISGSSE